MLKIYVLKNALCNNIRQKTNLFFAALAQLITECPVIFGVSSRGSFRAWRFFRSWFRTRFWFPAGFSRFLVHRIIWKMLHKIFESLAQLFTLKVFLQLIYWHQIDNRKMRMHNWWLICLIGRKFNFCNTAMIYLRRAWSEE